MTRTMTRESWQCCKPLIPHSQTFENLYCYVRTPKLKRKTSVRMNVLQIMKSMRMRQTVPTENVIACEWPKNQQHPGPYENSEVRNEEHRM